VRGAPLWGSLVALCEGERVLAGAAYFPAVDELVAAAPVRGCWWNGSRCQVSSVGALADATVLTTDERFPSAPSVPRHGVRSRERHPSVEPGATASATCSSRPGAPR
jgi:fructose-1,6-bisphosphatase/inositol monophosphatase family enzyme